jgi:hypothetical protein
MNFNNLAQGKHSSHITERSMEQEDKCHNIRSTLTPWKRVNKSPSWRNSQDNEGSARTIKNVKIRRTKRW